MKTAAEFIGFLIGPEQSGLHYRLDKYRDDALTVEVAVPGRRWEIELFVTGSLEIEQFVSDGEVAGGLSCIASLQNMAHKGSRL